VANAKINMNTKNKFFSLIFTITFFILPLSVGADGGVIRPMPDGDWAWVAENSQQAFINYEKDIEKLIIMVDIKKENSDIAWIMPIPNKPEKIEVDIVSEPPIFFGDDVMSKAKINFFERLATSYYAGLLGQIWTLPSVALFIFPGAQGGSNSEIVSGDLVSIGAHIEKAGMIAEVITAKNSRAIYDYFSQKGFYIKQGSITELNSYIEKDYSFVVSWITPGLNIEENNGQRGILITFPSSKIYYPLILTSAYGETKIPIVIRVLDHVKPEIFSEIKHYTKISYFIERTSARSGARGRRCVSAIDQLRTVLTYYHADHGEYLTSSRELEKIEDFKPLLQKIDETCVSSYSYVNKNKDGFTITALIRDDLYVVDSATGQAGFVNEGGFEKFISPELKKFYGNKNPWKGEAEYTKITINAPSNLLTKDLWMEKGRPFKISFILWTINNPLVIIFILYLLIVGISSFVAGGLVGLICFQKFKKYALIGLGNIFTLIGLILIYNYVKKKREEDVKHSRLKFILFIFLFSIIFVLLSTFLWIIM